MNSIEEKINHYLIDQSDIVAAYLFGSQITGVTHSNSDVDIALLYAAGKEPAMDQKLLIEDELTSIIKCEVDLVVLNEASPVIRMQVLRKGKKIIDRDHQSYINFFVRTIKEYEDLNRERSINEKSILRGRICG